MWPSIERANEQLDPRQQLANTPPPQSTTCLIQIQQSRSPLCLEDCLCLEINALTAVTISLENDYVESVLTVGKCDLRVHQLIKAFRDMAYTIIIRYNDVDVW